MPEKPTSRGLPAVIGTQFFSHVYLIEHGIAPAAVKIADISPRDLLGALTEGKVDAIVIYEPYASMALKALPGKAVKLPQAIFTNRPLTLRS